MLKFKFFENDNLEILEHELNKFASENEKEITRESIIKTYYNRTLIPDNQILHNNDTHSDEIIEEKKIVNSIILVWDKINQIDSLEAYEARVKEPIIDLGIRNLNGEPIKDIEEPSNPVEQELKDKILGEIDRIIINWHITSREEIINHMIALTNSGEVSRPWLKYIIANRLDELDKV